MLSLSNPPVTAGQGGRLQESISRPTCDLFFVNFFGVNEGLWLHARLYQTNLMQEFFFEVGLQDILFRNHPAHSPPPLKISMVSSILKNELLPAIYEINE